jgi:hypothetical protein
MTQPSPAVLRRSKENHSEGEGNDVRVESASPLIADKLARRAKRRDGRTPDIHPSALAYSVAVHFLFSIERFGCFAAHDMLEINFE